MIKFIFKIVFVQRGQEALWRGWVASGDSSGTGQSTAQSGLGGRFELIEAHDMEEAVQITQHRYPDCTVMRGGSEKICSA